MHNFAIAIGIARPDSIDREITVTVPGTSQYGNRGNSSHWVRQSYQNCTLIATAMAVGQVTGYQPTEAEMVELAKTSDSVVAPGQRCISMSTSSMGSR